MMTNEGPKVLEYNVRFGDPETQAITVRLKTDLVEICEAMYLGRLDELNVEWRFGASACVVVAAEGYPGKPRTGDEIHGLEKAAANEDVTIFHSGTTFTNKSDGTFATAGGRVLGVTATGNDLSSALDRAYKAVGEINWPGMQYRRDIGKAN
jgi:phosphoribosylamine--glycine ligase